jgi:hypothetical protein
MLNVIMLNVIMLNGIMLNVIMLNIIMLNVNMLNVIMLNVIMLNVMAPCTFLLLEWVTRATLQPDLRNSGKQNYHLSSSVERIWPRIYNLFSVNTR